MSRLINYILLVCVIFAGIGSVCAQENAVSIERYLSERGLDDLLAEHLVEQLAYTEGAERTRIAQQLGKLYVRLLDSSANEEDRRQWAERASNLLRLIPEADSPDLRINLAKAAYMRAEAVAERHRLLMASESEIAQAERMLRDASVTFVQIAQDAHQRSQTLSRQLSERLEEEAEREVNAALAKARQQRSLGFYYAGWSEYYYGLLTNDRSRSGRALRHFGWLLSAREGEEATYERLQPGLLRYEHVARSAIGSALACSELTRHIEAVAWLDEVARSTDITEEIRSQLYDRRIWILARAGMWADLDLIVRRARSSGSSLPPMSARLLVVGCMQALVGAESQGRSRELIRRLADAGFEDLIAQGEVGHVRELVLEYGLDSLGESGFIVLYVKGLVALDRASEAREASGDTGTGPVKDSAVAAFYREAGHALLASVEESDASRHAVERVRAITSAGSAFYLSGDAVLAADVLERAIRDASAPELAENALWLAVVALEDAVESGDLSLVPRRDQAAQLYLSMYPTAERSARLLMRPGTSGLLTDSEAVEILLAIQPASANYLAARRQGSQLLYRMYRAASASERNFTAQRFVDVAMILIQMENVEVRSGDVSRAERAAQSVVLRSRQVADAAMGMRTPDVERAEQALDSLDRIAGYASIDISDIIHEIAYRRIQIAVAKGDVGDRGRWYLKLKSEDNNYLATADRLLYRESVRLWLENSQDVSVAGDVVEFGERVVAQFDIDSPNQRVLFGVLDTISQAAGVVWEIDGDREMLDKAMAANERLIKSSGATGDVLVYQAKLTEQAGQAEESLVIWRRLVSALEPGTEQWFEARYESIRLLYKLTPAQAVIVLKQHILLYPDLGPSPWGSRLRELALSMGIEVPT